MFPKNKKIILNNHSTVIISSKFNIEMTLYLLYSYFVNWPNSICYFFFQFRIHSRFMYYIQLWCLFSLLNGSPYLLASSQGRRAIVIFLGIIFQKIDLNNGLGNSPFLLLSETSHPRSKRVVRLAKRESYVALWIQVFSENLPRQWHSPASLF